MQYLKNHWVSLSVSIVSFLLFLITCVSAYNAYYACTQGQSIQEQIYAAIVILISISSFIGFVIIMQIGHLVAIVRKKN